jgi:muconolactone delta-isomerase
MESQLLAYLESLDPTAKPDSDKVVRAQENDHAQKLNPVRAIILASYLMLVLAFHVLFIKLSEGFIWDISLILSLHSNSQTKLEIFAASLTTFVFPLAKAIDSQYTINILRRGVLVYLSLSCALYLSVYREGITGSSILNPFIYFILSTTLSLISAPIIFGILLSRWIDNMLLLCKRSERTTGAVISWVKKMQLTSMGRTLTNPLPPLAKIEEAARDIYGDSMMSCSETRRVLHYALSAFYEDLLSSSEDIIADDNATEGTDASKDYKDTNNEIHLSFVTAIEAARRNHMNLCKESNILSTSQLQNIADETFKSVLPLCFSYIDIHINPSSNHYNSGNRIIPIFLLKLPLFLTRIVSSIERLQCRLLLICREAQEPSKGLLADSCNASYYQEKVDGVSKSDAKRNTDVSDKGNDCYRYSSKNQPISSAYMKVRQQLLTLRLKAEGSLNRLWLCEQELSSVEITRLLYLDSLKTVVPSEPFINIPTAAVTASISGSKIIENGTYDADNNNNNNNNNDNKSNNYDNDRRHSPSTSDKDGIYHLYKALARLSGKITPGNLDDHDSSSPESWMQNVSDESYRREALEGLEADQLKGADLIALDLQIRELISLLANGVQSTEKIKNEGEGLTRSIEILELKESVLPNGASIVTSTIDESREGNVFESPSTVSMGKNSEGSSTSMAGIDTNNDISSRRVVDVYTATVPLSNVHSNGEPLLRNRASLSTHGSELGNAKMLLLELQTHIEMLEAQKGVVERMQTTDVDMDIATNHGDDIILSNKKEKEALLDTKNGNINTSGVTNTMKTILNSTNSNSTEQNVHDNVGEIPTDDYLLLPSHQNSNSLVSELSTVLNSMKGHGDIEFGDSSDDDF